MASRGKWLSVSSDAGVDDRLAPARWHLVLAVAAATVAFAAIAVASVRQSGPTVHPDEWGFLTNGQVLTGHPEAVLPTTSFYPAGFGLVTGLGALLSGSIQGAYRFTLMANLVLALLTAWAAARLARRVFSVAARASLLVALLILVLPGTLLSAVIAWPEVAARAAFIGFVYMVHRASLDPTRNRLVALTLFTGLLPALHGRFTLVLAVVGLAVVWMWRRKLVDFWVAAQSGCVLIAGYAVSHLLNGFIKSRVYLESYNQENRLLRRLVNPRLWPAVLRMMVGQGWYLVATTAGLFGVGIAYAVARTLQSRRELAEGTVRDPVSLTLTVTWCSVLVMVFAGSLQLLGFNRGDHLIYGRYVELTVPVVLVLAVASLDRAPTFSRRTWTACVFLIPVVASVYMSVDGKDGIAEAWKVRNVVFPNIVGTDAIRHVVPVGFIPFAIAFFVVASVIRLIAGRSRERALLGVLLLLSAGLVASSVKSVPHRTRFLDAVTASPVIIKRDGASEVAFDSSIANDPAYYYLRYKIHPVKLRYVRATMNGEPIPASISCMYEPEGTAPPAGSWEVISDEPAVSRVLWRRVGAVRC